MNTSKAQSGGKQRSKPAPPHLHPIHQTDPLVDPASDQLYAVPCEPTEDGIPQFTVYNPLNGKCVTLTVGVLKDDLRVEDVTLTPDVTRINVALRWQGMGDKERFIAKYTWEKPE